MLSFALTSLAPRPIFTTSSGLYLHWVTLFTLPKWSRICWSIVLATSWLLTSLASAEKWPKQARTKRRWWSMMEMKGARENTIPEIFGRWIYTMQWLLLSARLKKITTLSQGGEACEPLIRWFTAHRYGVSFAPQLIFRIVNYDSQQEILGLRKLLTLINMILTLLDMLSFPQMGIIFFLTILIMRPRGSILFHHICK